MKLCCIDRALCKRHQPPADNPSAPIYLAKGEVVQRNPETGIREIWVPGTQAEKAAPAITGTTESQTNGAGASGPWAAALF